MTSGAADARTAEIRRLIARAPGDADDTVGLLTRLCAAVTRELAAFGAGVSLLTDGGVRGVCAASDQASERLEDLQFVLGEGPCLDAFAARCPVLTADLSGPAMSRWPVYAPAAYAGGVRAVFAFPLQIGAARLGIMDVFRPEPGPLTSADLESALTFADVAVEALLDQQLDQAGRGNAEGLVLDVGNRAQLFQAQGMVMAQLEIPPDEALVRMRAYAYAENRRLDDVARDVVNRTLRFNRDSR